MLTDLHEQRLDVAFGILVNSGAHRVLDLGCGTGRLLGRLVEAQQFRHIVGVDSSQEALTEARQRLQRTLAREPGRVLLVPGCLTLPDRELCGFDACAMVETIEHLAPSRLSALEQTVFGCYRPRLVVMTTPNAEYNVLFGLQPEELRTPDHYFEWDRVKFRQWASGVADRHGYGVRFGAIGEWDEALGAPTQMAVFDRRAAT